MPSLLTRAIQTDTFLSPHDQDARVFFRVVHDGRTLQFKLSPTVALQVLFQRIPVVGCEYVWHGIPLDPSLTPSHYNMLCGEEHCVTLKVVVNFRSSLQDTAVDDVLTRDAVRAVSHRLRLKENENDMLRRELEELQTQLFATHREMTAVVDMCSKRVDDERRRYATLLDEKTAMQLQLRRVEADCEVLKRRLSLRLDSRQRPNSPRTSADFDEEERHRLRVLEKQPTEKRNTQMVEQERSPPQVFGAPSPVYAQPVAASRTSGIHQEGLTQPASKVQRALWATEDEDILTAVPQQSSTSSDRLRSSAAASSNHNKPRPEEGRTTYADGAPTKSNSNLARADLLLSRPQQQQQQQQAPLSTRNEPEPVVVSAPTHIADAAEVLSNRSRSDSDLRLPTNARREGETAAAAAAPAPFTAAVRSSSSSVTTNLLTVEFIVMDESTEEGRAMPSLLLSGKPSYSIEDAFTFALEHYPDSIPPSDACMVCIKRRETGDYIVVDFHDPTTLQTAVEEGDTLYIAQMA